MTSAFARPPAAAGSGGAPAAGDTQPTMAELQALADGKDWPNLLQKISKVLALHGDAATQYDRYDLLMMRGEAYVQTKQASSAVTAFTEAGKIQTNDEKKTAVADTSATLMKKAPNGIYTRKSPSSQPSDPKTIDVIDKSQRSNAFAAMAADDAAVIAPKVKTAVAGKTLNPIFELLKPIAEIRETELAASDGASAAPSSTTSPSSSSAAKDMLTSLADHAKEIETDSISTMKTKVDAIEKNANTQDDHGPSRTGNRGYGGAEGPDHKFRKRGLSGQDNQALKEVISTSKQLVTASKQFADAFGKELGAAFESAGKDATDLATHANQVLTADYSGTTNDPRTGR